MIDSDHVPTRMGHALPHVWDGELKTTNTESETSRKQRMLMNDSPSSHHTRSMTPATNPPHGNNKRVRSGYQTPRAWRFLHRIDDLDTDEKMSRDGWKKKLLRRQPKRQLVDSDVRPMPGEGGFGTTPDRSLLRRQREVRVKSEKKSRMGSDGVGDDGGTKTEWVVQTATTGDTGDNSPQGQKLMDQGQKLMDQGQKLMDQRQKLIDQGQKQDTTENEEGSKDTPVSTQSGLNIVGNSPLQVETTRVQEYHAGDEQTGIGAPASILGSTGGSLPAFGQAPAGSLMSTLLGGQETSGSSQRSARRSRRRR